MLINIHILRSIKMLAKVFKSGNSQAVRLPKEFRFDVDEVDIFKRGKDIVLRPKTQNLHKACEILHELGELGFANFRQNDPPQQRE